MVGRGMDSIDKNKFIRDGEAETALSTGAASEPRSCIT